MAGLAVKDRQMLTAVVPSSLTPEKPELRVTTMKFSPAWMLEITSARRIGPFARSRYR